MENKYQAFLKQLNNFKYDKSPEYSYSKSLFRHLIEYEGEEFFNNILNFYFSRDYPEYLDAGEDEKYNEDWYRFHKAMRQIDFTPHGGNVDMMWWNLFQISDAPYRELRLFLDELNYGF